MIGLPRFAARFPRLLALSLVTAGLVVCAAPVSAQQQELAAAPTTAPAVSPELKSTVSDFWHYGKIASYDTAVTQGQKILASGAEPQAVLTAFEEVAAEHQDAGQMDRWLLHWQGVDKMKDVTAGINDLIAQGYRARRSDPKVIQDHISRLTINQRAYGLAVSRLRESGELAVPFLLEILRDPSKRASHPTIRQALRDLGRVGLNPLVACTEMKDWDTLTAVLGVLGDLGYDSAAPYIARVFESSESPGAVKAVAADALAKLGAIRTGSGGASDMFFSLGEKFYDGESSITADNRFPTANIWYYGADGLSRKQVPHEIYSDIMAMRAAEYTLKIGGERGDDALSLWLAANYRREVDLPKDATDTTRDEKYPAGHYWGVSAGTKYLNAALARALKDHNAPVAFKAIQSLQEIVGDKNLFDGPANRPLIDALQYPDRAIRFEAALALAGAVPQAKFEGQQRVIPLLAEAIAQTGQVGVLVVMPTQDAVNKMVDDLKANAGVMAAGADSPAAAVAMSPSLSAVDVILVSEDIGAGHVDELFNMASANAKLAGATRLVLTKSQASLYEPRKVTEPLLNTTTATEAAGLKSAIEAARKRSGGIPLDSDTATQYAIRAAEMMIKVGISRGQIYDLMPAKQSLLAALSDTRPEIVKLSGQVLGLLNDAEAQAGLLMTASEEKTADEVKISLYKSLAVNAKFFGNRLESSQIESLEKTVADAGNLDVRSAAAEARGALNLQADKAKNLIVRQSKT